MSRSRKGFVECAICKARIEVKDTGSSVLAEAKRAGMRVVKLRIEGGRVREAEILACPECAKKLERNLVELAEAFRCDY